MKSRDPAGYTVLEVMIVLAVSAGLLLAAILMFGGRSGQAEAVQSVRNLEAKLQTIASDVATGYYPYATGFKCQADDLGGQPTVPPGATASGENVGCVYIGKVINFNTTPDMLNILTIAGRQNIGAIGSGDAKTLIQAKPLAIALAGGPDITQIYNLSYSLRVSKIVKLIDGTTTVGAIGFITQLGDSAGNPLTGSHSTLLYGLDGTSPNTDADTVTASKINNLAPPAPITYPALKPIPDGVAICLITGNGKKAEITIGASESQTGTAVTLDQGVGSEC